MPNCATTFSAAGSAWARNRLPVDTDIRDVEDSDLIPAFGSIDPKAIARGSEAIRRGEVAVLSLAAGVGSRWTSGAGVVKAVNPFVQLAGSHRSFLELHLAKTRKVQRRFDVKIPHVVTTSFLTHESIQRHFAQPTIMVMMVRFIFLAASRSASASSR